MARFVYLHGFASGPASRKAQFFREKLGAAIEVPDLAPDFGHTTISDQLARALTAIDGRPCTLIGSSMGGYMSALLAAGPARELVRELILLAPAFRLAERWRARMHPPDLQRWRTEGWFPFEHHVIHRAVPLHYEFLLDADRQIPLPDPPQRVLAFAGARDELVPVSVVEEFCNASPKREMVVVDSDHDLLNALDEIWSRLTARA